MEYTGQIQYIHSQLAPDMAIDAFVEALNPTAIGLANETQFYAPFRFSVQICGGINAAAGINCVYPSVKLFTYTHTQAPFESTSPFTQTQIGSTQ